jgi:hypothetical protein
VSNASVKLGTRPPQICSKLQFAKSRVEILPGRLQYQEVRSAAVFVVSSSEFSSFTKRWKNLVVESRQVLACLQNLRVRVSDFQCDLIADGHITSHSLLPLSFRDRDSALVSVEDGNCKSESWAGFETTTSGTVGIVDRVQIHELISSQPRSFTSRFDSDFGRAKIGPHRQCFVQQRFNR